MRCISAFSFLTSYMVLQIFQKQKSSIALKYARRRISNIIITTRRRFDWHTHIERHRIECLYFFVSLASCQKTENPGPFCQNSNLIFFFEFNFFYFSRASTYIEHYVVVLIDTHTSSYMSRERYLIESPVSCISSHIYFFFFCFSCQN